MIFCLFGVNGDIARFLSIVSPRSSGRISTCACVEIASTSLHPRANGEMRARSTKGALTSFRLMTFEGDTSSTDPTNQQMIPPHHDYLSALFEKDAF